MVRASSCLINTYHSKSVTVARTSRILTRTDLFKASIAVRALKSLINSDNSKAVGVPIASGSLIITDLSNADIVVRI